MKIGILTPSIYMYAKRYDKRIFAPLPLARNLVSGLVTRGHDISWFTAPIETSAKVIPGDLELLEKDLAVRTFQDITPEVKNKISLFATKMYYELDLLTRAFSMARRGEIEVFHNFHSFAYLAHFFEELTGVPTLFTLHDQLPTDEMLERWLLQRFPIRRLISISNSQQKNLTSHFIGTVYNGVDIHDYHFSPTASGGLVAVGRMVPAKGFEDAISLAKRADVELTIASWIYDNVERSAYYRDRILPFVDSPKIKVTSLLNREEIVKLYQQALALVFPIKWEEPFGMVMIEAMACGTPVVAYNRGSVPEIVKDGVTGFIIDPDNADRPGKGSWMIKKQGIEGLVEAVSRIGEIDRASCRRHVEEKFSVEKMVEGYETLYREALK